MKLFIGSLLALVVGAALLGCSPAAPAEESTTPPATTGSGETSKTEGGATAEPVAFKKDGKLWCPVMDTEVESVEKAVGYQDVDGVRYYFCCAGCPEPFKEDPNKYVSKFPKS